MSDTESQEEPNLLGKVERIMSLRQEGTERLRKLWTDGEIDELPCHDACTGEIVVYNDDVVTRGLCPAYMQKDVCVLTTKSERELRARLSLAGFGKLYQDPDPVMIRPKKELDAWLSNLTDNMRNGRGMILSGGVGVGKTFCLAYVTRNALLAGRGVWMVLMEHLNSALMDREKRSAVVRRAVGVEVLMLDDFGAGEIQPYVLGILEGIVEHRNANKRPMFITTNLTKDQLRAEPAFRRMVDRWRQNCLFVNVGGESQRG